MTFHSVTETLKCIQLISYFWHKQPPPNSLSINMGLTKLICLGGILNIPPKISIHKAGQRNWVIYDLFTPLERLTEDIIQSCQSNWLFAWKRNTMQPIREQADLRRMPSESLSPKWPFQQCHLCCYCVKIKLLLSESYTGRKGLRFRGTGKSVHIHAFMLPSPGWHGYSWTPSHPHSLLTAGHRPRLCS